VIALSVCDFHPKGNDFTGGGDVFCMMPTKDSQNKITAISAAAIMFEMICLTAKSCQK
jgi:hypothetical protein